MSCCRAVYLCRITQLGPCAGLENSLRRPASQVLLLSWHNLTWLRQLFSHSAVVILEQIIDSLVP